MWPPQPDSFKRMLGGWPGQGKVSEVLGNRVISNCASQSDRRNATRVGAPRIRASSSKELNHFAATPTAEGSTPERRVAVFVDWIYLGASFQESTHNAS